jgi:hypothetical protein
VWRDHLKEETYKEGKRLIRISIGFEEPTPEEKSAALEPISPELFRMVKEKFVETKFLQETPFVLEEATKKVLQGSPDDALRLLAKHLDNLINESKANPEIIYDYGWAVDYVREFGDTVDKNYENIKEGKVDEDTIRWLESIVERSKTIGIESMLPFISDLIRKKLEEVV